MSISMGFFTFLNAWFLMLFFVGPFFVRPAQTHSEVEYAAAPQAMKWKKLFMTNTIASIVLTLLIALVLHSNFMSLRDAIS